MALQHLTETPRRTTVDDLARQPINANGDNRLLELWYAARRQALGSIENEARRAYRLACGRDARLERELIQADHPPVSCYLRRSPFVPMDLNQPPRLMAEFLRTNHELTTDRYEELGEAARFELAAHFARQATIRRILPETEEDGAGAAAWTIAACLVLAFAFGFFVLAHLP